MVGRSVHHLTAQGEVAVVAIDRDGQALVPTQGTEFREGDLVYLSVLASAMERVEQLLGLERRQ